MAEKKLTLKELDKIGLDCIEIDWDNKKKLITLFRHFIEKGDSLPSSGVNNTGDLIPNLCMLARLAKIIQGKQVFKALYARIALDRAIEISGIQSLSSKDEADETTLVREKMQDTIDLIRYRSSNIDKKLQIALDEIEKLTEENSQLQQDVIEIIQELKITKMKLNLEQKRNIKRSEYEQISLKSTY